MRKRLLIISALAAVACISWFGISAWYYHKEPPPGWRIVEDGKGNYAPQDIASGYVIPRNYRALTYGMSKQAAINRAWGQYEYEQAEANKRKEWH